MRCEFITCTPLLLYNFTYEQYFALPPPPNQCKITQIYYIEGVFTFSPFWPCMTFLPLYLSRAQDIYILCERALYYNTQLIKNSQKCHISHFSASFQLALASLVLVPIPPTMKLLEVSLSSPYFSAGRDVFPSAVFLPINNLIAPFSIFIRPRLILGPTSYLSTTGTSPIESSILQRRLHRRFLTQLGSKPRSFDFLRPKPPFAVLRRRGSAYQRNKSTHLFILHSVYNERQF